MNYEELINKKFDESVKGLTKTILSDMESWYSYVSNLPDDLRVTYTIVILHQQVFNGGFHQYFFNAYGMFAYLTIDSLEKIKASFTKDLLKRVLDKVNDTGMDITLFKEVVFTRKLDKVVNFDDELGDYLEKCDEEYYESDEDITLLLGKYLQSA